MPTAPAAPQETVKPEDFGSLTGVVFNAATGEPLRKASVILRRTMEGGQGGMQPVSPSSYSATSDASGQFTLKDVPPGRYRLMAERAGFGTQNYGAKGPNAPGSIISLGRAQHMKDLTFRMTQQGVITGRVLDEDGDPVMNAMVSCMRQAYVRGRKQWVPVNGQNTNDLGEYRMHSLAAGRYFVSATYRPPIMLMTDGSTGNASEESYAPTYYPSAASLDLASAVEVASGGQVRNIDIQLRKSRTVRVKGRVSLASGKPVRNSVVRAAPRSDSSFDFMPRMGRVDIDGRFTIAGLTPGSYWLVADSAEEGNRLTGRVAIEVGAANIENVSLTLEPLPEIQGLIKVAGGGELKMTGLRVQLQPKRIGVFGGGAGAQASETGTFTVKGVNPESYDVQVFGAPDTHYVKTVRWGQADVTETGLDLSQGITAAEFEITLAAGAATVDGSVQNDKQQPASSATIVLIPQGSRTENAQYYKLTTSDQTGAFSLKGVVPGEYRVFAFDQIESGAQMDPEFMKPFESKGERVSLKENGHESLKLKLIDTAENR